MAHQNHLGHPMHVANVANHQNFHYGGDYGGAPQGEFVPPMYPPPGMPQPPFAPHFMHPGPQYAQPLPMVPHPYGQLQAYQGPMNPQAVNQQAVQAPPGLVPAPAHPPQPAFAPKNRPNREVRPGVFAFQVE